MADLLGTGIVKSAAPAWWPGPLQAPAGETLIRVSFWVSALARVLDAIEATSAATGLDPVIQGSAGAGVLYVWLSSHNELNGESRHGGVADFVAALRSALAGERGAVAVLAAPALVREGLAGRGGMNGPVPGLALMRAVKDQFDPSHRMSPGRFPEDA
jgi:glycolate oxidase FAD binding subunit